MIVCFVEKSESKPLQLACSWKCVMQTTSRVCKSTTPATPMLFSQKLELENVRSF